MLRTFMCMMRGNASQGFSVWTEENPGCGSDWCFLLPNLYDKKLCGADCDGVAIKLSHGTAISWDGRALRHCTSVSRPDGAGSAPVGSGWTSVNHLFGTFSAAKEKIVAAGSCCQAEGAVAGDNKEVAQHQYSEQMVLRSQANSPQSLIDSN